jgi:phytol kinase
MITAFFESLDSFDPVQRNVLAALATVVYVKAVVGTCDYLVSRKLLAPKISRKCIHMAAGSWILFWPCFDTSHWTWMLNVLVPAVYTVQLFVKGAILKDPNDQDVLTMTRTGSPEELLNGPIIFTIIMTIVGLKLYRTQLGVVLMACLGYGDGIAPLVGYYFPCGTHYPTFPYGPTDKKTLTGSLGFYVASLVGYQLLKGLILDSEREFATGADELAMMMRVAAIVAVTEGISGEYDNPCIALVVTLSYSFVVVPHGINDV